MWESKNNRNKFIPNGKTNANTSIKNIKEEKKPNTLKFEFNTKFYNSKKLDAFPEPELKVSNNTTTPEVISKKITLNENNSQNSNSQKINFAHEGFHRNGFTCTNVSNKVVSNWAYRYGRSGYIRKSVLDEDQELFKEHSLQMKQKSTFVFKNLETQKLKILLNDTEIFSESSVKSFSDVKFNQMITDNLTQMGYDLMTPIQRYILPYVLERKDVIGCAQTGSGKTVAFLAPIVNIMLEEGPPPEDDRVPPTHPPRWH